MRKCSTFNTSTSHLEVVLEQVRRDFVNSLPQKIVQLRAIQKQLELDRLEESLELAGFLAHRVCGIAKTLGYEQLGETAEKLDVAVSDLAAKHLQFDKSEIIALVISLVAESEAVVSRDLA